MNADLRDLRIALLGVPNCGKTALFNRLTGSQQKVANYPGVTVERKEGNFKSSAGRSYHVLDLPGTYSLSPTSLDEAITRDVALGRLATQPRPELLVCVADATHLRLSLRLVLDAKRVGLPMMVALNMSDIARRRGYVLDVAALSRALGVPVVATVAVASRGADALVTALDTTLLQGAPLDDAAQGAITPWSEPTTGQIEAMYVDVQHILRECGYHEPLRARFATQVDQVVLHPVLGLLILGSLLFLVFQAVFSWAAAPMAWINSGVAMLGQLLTTWMPDGLLRSLLIDGVLAGIGSVIVFLPQILILFFFILLLEDSGYLPRAAYLLDRVMGSVGLSGRAFIPLLSSFACAIPGIMATRTIPNARDRIATIMIAPLMTCSARLPIYTLLIAAFVPATRIGPLNQQGLALFTLYLTGVLSALLVAFVIKRLFSRGEYHPLLLELPEYQWPNLQNLLLGLWQRVKIFLSRVGGIILALMVVLWFLSTFPAPPPGATEPAIAYSFAGKLGHLLQYVFAPIGFNWQISIALVPGMAAREVAVSALGTVYAMSASGDNLAGALQPVLAQQWSLATALSLLAWYVFAPQCLSTLAVVRRETNSWRYPIIMAVYLFALAYLAAFLTFRVASSLWGS